ncbi:MAG: ATP-binding protein [Bacteroidales bacterium]|nr:ATP-binding protein [Bacteroidales bacterium]
MFKRNINSWLEKWATNPNRKPLVLRGARQVGKTTAVKQFARQYDTFLFLNLEKEEHRKLFEPGPSFSDLLMAIYLINGQTRDNSRTLLFIDEVQNSPQAVAMLRYFYEEAPQMHVIAAGSLLESLMDKNISFPVGRVEYVALRPCAFNEFLDAIAEPQLAACIEKGEVPEILHEKMLGLFNKYTLIGGMPEVVANYAASKDLVALRTVYDTLLTGYRDDTEKYARNNTQRQVLRHILQSGFSYNCERIKYERFGSSDYRSREIGEAFRSLEKTMLLELVWPITGFTPPMISDIKKSPRLMWLDSGLVNYAAGVQKEVFGAIDISNIWRGKVAEQIVGQEMIAGETSVIKTRNFWVREAKNSNAEVDFVMQHNSIIIPIEVKSGANTRLRSLHLFMEKAPHDIAIRVWSQPLKIDDLQTDSGKKFRLISIPFYLAGQITKVIDMYYTPAEVKPPH